MFWFELSEDEFRGVFIAVYIDLVDTVTATTLGKMWVGLQQYCRYLETYICGSGRDKDGVRLSIAN